MLLMILYTCVISARSRLYSKVGSPRALSLSTRYKIQETLFNVGYSKTVNISYRLFSDKHEYKNNSKYSSCKRKVMLSHLLIQ